MPDFKQERVNEMKINEHFLTQDIDGDQVIVATGDAKFNGIVRSNKTAAEIVDFMKAHTLNDARMQLQIHKFIWDPEMRGV